MASAHRHAKLVPFGVVCASATVPTSGVNFSGLYHARGLATSPTSVRSRGRRMLRPSLERASRRVMEGPSEPDKSGCRSARPARTRMSTGAQDFSGLETLRFKLSIHWGGRLV